SDGVNPATEKAVTLSINNLDEVAPTITSGATASVNENDVTNQVVYTATADDTADISAGVTFRLKNVGDFSHFHIDETTGKVTLLANPVAEPNFPSRLSSDLSDGVNPATEKAVTLSINDLDDNAPIFASDTYATSVSEHIS